MSIFAFTLPLEMQKVLFTIVKVLFVFFILTSFVYVAIHVAKQARRGRMFTTETAPLPLIMQPPPMGWLFIFCVLGLVYLQSILFPVVIMIGLVAIVVQNQRTLDVQFGFDRLRVSRALTVALLTCGAVILVETPLSGLSTELLDFLRVPHPDQESVQTFRQFTDAESIVWFLFLAVIVSPFFEEFFFRGFLLTYLKNYTSTPLAIVLSGGIFAFAHLNIGAAIPLWFLGIVLAIAYEHTGSLLVPIAAHACFNLATGLSLLLDKVDAS
jgi:membrane protease YdiL (CAAX protease family)